ncbi:hypothetical protein ADEAN_000704600 [Angomonas deanei]|uniref:Uncharacterized protein n=1 Tax=Angomonas deanei TaxID=59799 RepID=A0A7G2CI58_9TRYP|nr:hypothetical protein ADEAN_000704600 [Angomonas deanei]
MKKRHEENKAELVEEINRTEREKYARQLKQLTDNYKATVDSLTSLRRQRALLIRENGLSEQGILLQLSTAMESSIKSKKKEKSSDSEERSKSEQEYESDFLSASEGQEEEKEEEAEDEEDKTREVSLEPEEEVDAAFDAALQVILRYVDGRLTTVRDGVVDYVHDSTLEAAHEVQLERAKGWTEDAVQRKKELGAYVQEMMNNFLFFYRERGELKQKNITVLREGMRHTAELFREGAKERLASLLTEVTQKLTSASRAFESTVRENALLQERKAAATREGDYSVAEAQLSDIRRRCQTEANVRRTLFQSQMDTLRQQVEKIRHSGDLLSQEQSKSLMERSLQSGRAVEKVQTGLSLLQAKVEQHTNTLKKGNGLDLVTHTAAEELAIRSQDLSRAIALLLEEASQKEGVLRRDRVRLQTAQEEFLHYLETGVVDALRDGRLMRQAEGARLDHLRLAWEKTHRHNLSMPHVFEVEMPTAVPGGKAVTGCSTFTSPLEASLTALLEMLANTLKERDESHRQLRRTRDGQLNTYTKEVHRLCDQYRQLQKEWQRYGEQLEQLEEARGGLVTERVHCGEEAARIAITREVLEGKSRELDRRRRQLERQIQSSAMESEKVQAAYDNQQSSLAKATEERLLEVQRLYAAVPPPVIQKEAPAPHRHRPHRAHDLSQESATPPQPLPSSRVAPDDGASKSSSSKSPIKRKKTANNNAVFHSAGRKQTARREDTVKVGELEESGVSEMATPPSQERSGFQSEATPYRHRDQTLSPFRSSTFTELVSLMESTIYTSS